MICLKICTFVVSATTLIETELTPYLLWFAWKFVPLWYQQQLIGNPNFITSCCDLLENLYLCGISNNIGCQCLYFRLVVICLKICTFVVSATTGKKVIFVRVRCDLLENLYLCGISNNSTPLDTKNKAVVICLKICTFVVSATTGGKRRGSFLWLWFAWKFVPLWYQQQQEGFITFMNASCDLLENLYLCGISNNTPTGCS